LKTKFERQVHITEALIMLNEIAQPIQAELPVTDSRVS